MTGPVVQTRIYAQNRNASTQSYTLPAWFLLMGSPSVSWAIGFHPIVLHKRIADELGIQDGDVINFEILEFAQEYSWEVKVLDNFQGDFVIHGALPSGLLRHAEVVGNRHGTQLSAEVTGTQMILPEQGVFSGLKVIRKGGTCKLYFDGGCRNNPHGPAGWGYCILAQDGTWLVKAYGNKSGKNYSNNYMEYQGLLEGMIWATRLDPKAIEIYGDSELIIHQITGTCSAKNPELRECRDAFQSLKEKSEKGDTIITVNWIPRDENSEADKLANQAMDRLESKVTVNWNNVRKFQASSSQD